MNSMPHLINAMPQRPIAKNKSLFKKRCPNFRYWYIHSTIGKKRNLGLSNADYKNLLQGHVQAYEPKSTPKTDSDSPEGL